jgi:predicted DNA-binding ribbon-helix-helix protein
VTLRRPLPIKSPIVKRSVRIDGRKTTVGLEDAFWNASKKSRPTGGFRSNNLFLKLTTNASTTTCRRLSACSF